MTEQVMRSEQMTVAIIGAMDEEVIYFKQVMSNINERNIANVTFYEGTIGEQKVVLLQSGIGKVNAAMATTILMEQYKPTAVINTGTAGGLKSDAEVGDIVIANEVVHHDVDVTVFDYAYGQVPQMPATYPSNRELLEKVKRTLAALDLPYSIGLVGTGDSFMSDPNRVAFVKEKFPMIHAAEMEAAAIAQVCYQYDVPFIVIRALSDIAGKDSAISFEQFVATASKNATKMIQHVLEQ